MFPRHRARDELPGPTIIIIGVRGKENQSDVIMRYSRPEPSLTFIVQREWEGSLFMSYQLDRCGGGGRGWLPAARGTTQVQTFKVSLETNETVIEAIDREGDIV